MSGRYGAVHSMPEPYFTARQLIAFDGDWTLWNVTVLADAGAASSASVSSASRNMLHPPYCHQGEPERPRTGRADNALGPTPPLGSANLEPRRRYAQLPGRRHGHRRGAGHPLHP